MTVSYDFTGKTAVVTGGARGIGKAIAIHEGCARAD
ncbi:3-oxoacyl-[acyl-carrier protein] reductase [Rhizobiales bacterium GAS191]|nr:3-oxoacyl-[acyl-carrier protein] reductase [Rhizobiales bacterium GAS191]